MYPKDGKYLNQVKNQVKSKQDKNNESTESNDKIKNMLDNKVNDFMTSIKVITKIENNNITKNPKEKEDK